MPKVSIIAAVDSARGIGKNNRLMWYIAEDMRHFKEITRGHAVVMGRKTFESIGRPLPQRVNIIVSRNKDFMPAGCIVVGSLTEALDVARKKEEEEIFIIGGGQIYEQSLPYADKLYLTIVEGEFGADTFFPPYEEFDRVISKRASQSEAYKYKFLEIERSKDGKKKN